MKQTLLLLILIIHIQAFAQDSTYFFTVEQAVQHAVQNNVNLSKSSIDQQIIDAQIAEVKGRALPQVNATGRFTDNFSLAEQQLPAEIFGGEPGTTIPVAFGNRYSLNGGVDVQQQLLDFRLFSSLKSVNALKELRELQKLQTTEDLVTNVVQLYIQIQVTNKQLELLDQNYYRTDNLIRLSQLKLEEGIIKKLDLNQLIVNRSNLATQVDDVKYSLQEQLRLFRLYLNLPMDAVVELTEKLDDTSRYPLQDELTLASNIQYQQVLKQQELAQVDQELVRSEALPRLNAFFNYNYQGNTNEFRFRGEGYASQWNGTWGLSLSVPIFDGFQRKSRLQQRKLTSSQLVQDETLVTLTIQKQYQDAVEQIALSEKQIDSQNQNMELADENYEGIKLSYNEGLAPLTELLDAEFALRQAQSSYLNALLQFKVAELRVLKASGQLSSLISEL